VQVSHTFTPRSAVFDEDNLVSCAGLVPVMALAEQAGLSRLLDNNIHITSTRVKSGAANPAPKLATLIAGMCAGADYIDDVDLVRAGGMKTLFHRVYAPSTVGTLLREFTFGHARQLDAVLTGHLAGLCQRVNLLPGSDVRAFSLDFSCGLVGVVTPVLARLVWLICSGGYGSPAGVARWANAATIARWRRSAVGSETCASGDACRDVQDPVAKVSISQAPRSGCSVKLISFDQATKPVAAQMISNHAGVAARHCLPPMWG
jgi:hypothetical protein